RRTGPPDPRRDRRAPRPRGRGPLRAGRDRVRGRGHGFRASGLKVPALSAEGGRVKTGKGILLVLAVAAAAVALAACGSGSSSTGGTTTGSSGSNEGGTLVGAYSAFPDYLDPALSHTIEGWTATFDTYIPLLTYAHASGKARSE